MTGIEIGFFDLRVYFDQPTSLRGNCIMCKVRLSKKGISFPIIKKGKKVSSQITGFFNSNCFCLFFYE